MYIRIWQIRGTLDLAVLALMRFWLAGRQRPRGLAAFCANSQAPLLQGSSSADCSLPVALDCLENHGTAQIDSTAYGELLRRCSDAKALLEGKRVHAHILRSRCRDNVFLNNLLIRMYGNCGYLEDARKVFEKVRQPNKFSWTIMFAAYAQYGHLLEARSLFDQMPERDVAAWNAMIAAYAQNGHGKEALQLYREMLMEGVLPCKFTFISAVDACAMLTDLAAGKTVHDAVVLIGLQGVVPVGNALINLYGKCSGLDEARDVFENMHSRDVVSWTAMITAYAHNEHGKEAFELFKRMTIEGINPNMVTYISALEGCVNLTILEGRLIHAAILESELESELRVCNALLNMYGKFGSIGDAQSLFCRMPQRNIISWTAMVAAYAQVGLAREALDMFQLLLLEGMEPNLITFMSVLSACSHAGLLRDGWSCFTCMKGDLGLEPTITHYVSMIDLLGRAGQLPDAEDLINNMPFVPGLVAWVSLLGACKALADVERGARVAEQVKELEKADGGSFVLRSHIYKTMARI